MKSIHKFKSGLISAAMVCGSVLIAGGILLWIIEPTETERNKNKAIVNWSRVNDDSSQELNISWMARPVYVSAQSNGWIQRNLEKHFNIKLDPRFLDSNSYRKKRPLLLASGDIPDVMWDGDPIGVRNNIRNGFILEIPYDLILKHAPTYVELLNKHGKEAWLYAWYNGKNYGLPTFNDDASSPRVSTWRKDWLRNVGIDKVPETIAEMEEALRRFRHDDPDKNGVKDTYGWSPYIGHWSLAYIELFAAHDNLPFDFIKRGNKIAWGGIQPECKELLAILRRWYKEELIDPDFMADSQNNDMETKFVNGKTGYMHPVDGWNAYNLAEDSSLASKLKKLCPGGEIVPGPPLRNKEGKRVGRTWGGAAHVMQFGAPLARQPEKVIRVLKMLEEITKNEKLYVETRSGKEGKHWYLDSKLGIELLPKYKENRSAATAEMVGNFRCSFFYPCNLSTVYHDKYTRQEVKDYKKNVRNPEWALMNPLGKSDILPSASRYLANLRVLQQQVYAKIIIGELPLSYFDTFVKEWKRRGGDTLTGEANEMYKTMLKVYKKVGVK